MDDVFQQFDAKTPMRAHYLLKFERSNSTSEYSTIHFENKDKNLISSHIAQIIYVISQIAFSSRCAISNGTVPINLFPSIQNFERSVIDTNSKGVVSVRSFSFNASYFNRCKDPCEIKLDRLHKCLKGNYLTEHN